jgi:hypothetical protein
MAYESVADLTFQLSVCASQEGGEMLEVRSWEATWDEVSGKVRYGHAQTQCELRLTERPGEEMQASEEEEEAGKERWRAGKRRKMMEEAAATTRATAERAERAEEVLLAARQAAERREAGESDGDSEHDPLGMAAARVGQWRRPRRRQATAAGMGHVARHEYVIEVGRGDRGGGSVCDEGADSARRAAASKAAWQRERASAAAEKAEAGTAVASAAAASGPGRQTAAAQRMATAQRTMASEGPQAEGAAGGGSATTAGRPKSDRRMLRKGAEHAAPGPGRARRAGR